VRAALAPLDPQRTIEVDCPAPVEVAGDTGLLRRVMENLVSNAFKHTPSGGRVRIGVNGGPERARITVQDEGAGVPVEARRRACTAGGGGGVGGGGRRGAWVGGGGRGPRGGAGPPPGPAWVSPSASW